VFTEHLEHPEYPLLGITPH